MTTIDDVIKTVRDLAKESPDNIYDYERKQDACSYVNGICSNGSVGCIFGQAFKRLRILNSALLAVAPIEAVLRVVCNLASDDLDKVQWCAKVQRKQDSRHTWQEAVRLADKQMDEEKSAKEGVEDVG